MGRERDRLDSSVIFVNPTGAFLVGGPKADAGLTGRKIIVDTYGGMGRHGGGACSGKDPSQVDRSAASMARYIAKSVVAAELADVCEVQMASGHAHPVCVRVETVNPRVSNDKISQAIQDVFDRRPAVIIERLNLLRPIYRATAAYGHFGRPEFPWEASDRVVEFQRAMRSGGVPRRIVLCVLRAAAQLSTRALDPCPFAQVYACRNDGGERYRNGERISTGFGIDREPSGEQTFLQEAADAMDETRRPSPATNAGQDAQP
jgi:hypothetical protein